MAEPGSIHTRTRQPPCRQLLFLGGVDSAVRVFMRPPGGAFTPQCTLRGHDNWVSGLAAARAVSPSGTPIILAASASHDRTARLWRLTCTDAATPPTAQPVRLPCPPPAHSASLVPRSPCERLPLHKPPALPTGDAVGGPP